MRSYEIMYIIDPNVSDEERAAIIEKFKQVVTNNGGELVKVDEWGKRKLAYKVKKHNEGYYVVMDFKSSPEVSREVERLVKIDEKIIRYLLVKLEEEQVG